LDRMPDDPTDAFHIRPVAPADSEAVVSLWRIVFPEYGDPSHPHRDAAASVARKLAEGDGLFWLAEREGRVMGTAMAGYDGHRGWLYSVGVHPEARGGGLGRRLVAEAERALQLRGCPKVNLQAFASSTAAQRFWRRLGYAPDEALLSFGKKLPSGLKGPLSAAVAGEAPGPDGSKPSAPHSREWLGARSRSFLWDLEYLRLMARRWSLDEVREALDVGCGLGHWSFALAEVLPLTARLTGVDREPEWVRRVAQAAIERGLTDRFHFEEGTVERLPFADESFDLVTCQTLLIHLADPVLALREMARVLRPGGLLVAAEPANRAAQMLYGSLHRSPERVAERVRFYLTCERGRVACGDGDLSVGDRLPGMIAALGMGEVRVGQWEHAAALFPPYPGPQQQAIIADLRGRFARGIFISDRETTRRYFTAGGGDGDRFEKGWNAALADLGEVLAAIEAGTFHSGGGSVLYLVWARKP